jgi:hypothetical protein
MAFLDSLFSHPPLEPEGSFSFDDDWFPGERGSNKRPRIDGGHDYSFDDLPLDGIEDSSEELDSVSGPFLTFQLLPLDESPRRRQSSSTIPDDLTLPSPETSLESVNRGN